VAVQAAQRAQSPEKQSPENQSPDKHRSVFLGSDATGGGRRISMLFSVLGAVAIWLFFFDMRGWKPAPGTESEISAYVHWVLLLYLGLQLTVLVWTSTGGSRGEVWVDTLTTLVPVCLVGYALVEHWRGLASLPLEQLRLAKSTFLTVSIDFIVDFGVAMATQRRWMFVRRHDPADELADMREQ
jgi:hypothetical protein